MPPRQDTSRLCRTARLPDDGCVAYFQKMPMMPSDLSDPSDRPGAAFQGRGRQYLSLLACPVDGAPLAMGQNEAVCVADSAHRYPIEAGILRLADGGLRAALDEMSRQHEDDAAAEGWQTPDEEAFKRLPQTGLKGYPEFHWTQYAEATAVLWRYLEAIRAERGALPVGPVGEAAVIGADTGWLAYALDVAGYTTIALDAYVGEGYGLGVYPIARYVRVQADPVHPPLARGAFDIVLFQEGLARSREAADEAAALARAIEAVSYTHLDVYKRQTPMWGRATAWASTRSRGTCASRQTRSIRRWRAARSTSCCFRKGWRAPARLPTRRRRWPAPLRRCGPAVM